MEGPAALGRRPRPLVKSRGTYRSFAGIGLDSIYPVVQGYKDSAAVGVRLNFSDPVQLNKLNLTASYSPDGSLPSDERFHVDARYERYDWSARVRWNAGDFYDLFGPTKTSMKGYSFRVGYQKALLYDKPRELPRRGERDVLRRARPPPRLPERRDGLRHALRDPGAPPATRTSATRSAGVDEEKGHAWDVGFAGDRVNGKSYPKVWGTYDVGFALPIRHSSVWLRTTAGWTPRVRTSRSRASTSAASGTTGSTTGPRSSTGSS